MSAKVSDLLYRPTAVPNAYVYMAGGSSETSRMSWVLHSGTQYWIVDRHRSIPLHPDTTYEAALEILRHARGHA